MAIPLTSIGVKLSLAQESVAGTRPTSGYRHMKGYYETAAINAAPEMLETTTFENLVYKTYTQGLIDLSGALAFTARFTQEFVDTYDEEYEKYETARDSGLATWLCIDFPGLDKSAYVPVELPHIGVPGFSTNEVLDIDINFTMSGEPEFAADPTYAS